MTKLTNMLAAAAVLSAAVVFSSFGKFTGGDQKPAFFKIGHRGTRGLMPENTIPAMIKAVELGANTLEMDVHITKDGKVVVYHDASVTPDYTLMPDGSEVPAADRKKYTFYQMNYADIRKFIIGTKKYAAFPQQQHLASYAPLLGELIDSVDRYTAEHKLPKVNYLVEIKSSVQTDGFEQPAPDVVVNKVMAELQPKKLGKRLIIQSFDVRPLKVMHTKYPKVTLGFLTGDAKVSMQKNLADLGFNPKFYNPHYGLVTAQMVDSLHKQGMQIAPWTVNDLATMKKMKALNVDGIITDYPNYFKELLPR